MNTAYRNMLTSGLKNLLCRVMNIIVDKDGRKQAIVVEMSNITATERNQALNARLWTPLRTLKTQLLRRQLDITVIANQFHEVADNIQALYDSCYHGIQQFQLGEDGVESIYVDASMHPQRHLKMFFRMCRLIEDGNLRRRHCFPVRTTLVPSYITIDKTALGQMLQQERPGNQILHQVYNLQRGIITI